MRTIIFLLLTALPVAAADPPVRVAALLPYVADAFSGVAGPVVVAATRRDLRQPVAPPVLDLGNPHTPSLERLAEAKPDLVVGDRMLNGSMRDALAEQGGALVLLDSSSVATTLDGLQEVGKKANVPDAMAAKVAHTREAIAAATVTRPVPTLLLFGTPGSFLVVSDSTWLGDLAKQVGLQNVGAGLAGHERHPGYVQVSDEVLVGVRPELVLLVAHGDPRALTAALEQRLADGGPWQQVRASATRGVHVLPPDLFAANPGLRMDEAAQHLERLATAKAGS